MENLLGSYQPCRHFHICTLLLLGAAITTSAASEDVDGDVLQFRSRLSVAVSQDDLEGLYSLAYDTDPETTELEAEIDALKASLSDYLSTAFDNLYQDYSSSASKLLGLASLGESVGVGSTQLATAKSTALTLAQASLDSWLGTDDADEIMEAMWLCERAGCTQTSIDSAAAVVQEAAAADLQDAMDSNETGNLIQALHKATALGVSNTVTEPAKVEQRTRIQSCLAAAEASTDLDEKFTALRYAENSDDSALDAAAASARETLISLANQTINNAEEIVNADFAALEDAVELAQNLGLKSEGNFEEALDLVIQEHRKADIRAAVVQATREEDPWKLLVLAQDAASAGLPADEVSEMQASAEHRAREMLESFANSSEAGTVDGLENAELMHHLASAAGLPSSEMSTLNSQITTATNEQYEAAVASGTIAELVDVLRDEYLAEAKVTAGKAILQTRVTSWISSASTTDGQECDSTLSLLSTLKPVQSWLSADQFGQVQSIFLTQVQSELAAATSAKSTERLGKVLMAEKQGREHFWFEDPEVEGAQAARSTFETLRNTARELEQRLTWRADATQRLEAAKAGSGAVALREALEFARLVGMTDSELSSYDSLLTSREAASGLARRRLVMAIAGDSISTLEASISRAEWAGLAEDDPEIMASAYARLEELELAAAATTTSTTTVTSDVPELSHR